MLIKRGGKWALTTKLAQFVTIGSEINTAANIDYGSGILGREGKLPKTSAYSA
jgi:hypothetical protein